MTLKKLPGSLRSIKEKAPLLIARISAASVHWPMRRKVRTVFGVTGLTMAALALITIGSLFAIRSSVGEVTELADINQALLRVQARSIAAQSLLKDYVIRPDEHLATEVDKTLVEALESLDDADAAAGTLDQEDALTAVRAALKATRASSAKIVNAQRTIGVQVGKELDVRGPIIAGKLRIIAEQTHGSGRHDASYAASVAQALYLEMRVNVTRYRAAPNAATAQLAKSNLLDLEDAMNILFEKLEGTPQLAVADKIIAELVAYDKAFDRVIGATKIRDREVNGILQNSGPALARNANAIVNAIDGVQGRRTLYVQAASLGAVTVAIIASAIGIGVALLAGLLVQRLITRPIAEMAEGMNRLAAGDLIIDIDGTDRKDEIGDMARAVEIFRSNAQKIDERRSATLLAERREVEREQQQAREREEERIRAEGERRTAMLALADRFETNVRSVVEAVSALAQQIETDATLVSQTVNESGRLTADVAITATQASQSSLIVANATEEMSLSIAHVAEQIGSAARIAQEASQNAAATDAVVSDLIADTETIEDVVGLIARIAGQTNLLALNATIEAARAGAAGRGFAIVASEIKNLASQTGDAAKEVAEKIARARCSSGSAASALTGIARIIGQVNDIAGSVATAMDQQATTTSQIAQSTSQAADGSQNVAQIIAQVHDGVGATGRAAQETLRAAANLNRQADTLKVSVDDFLSTVRAA